MAGPAPFQANSRLANGAHDVKGLDHHRRRSRWSELQSAKQERRCEPCSHIESAPGMGQDDGTSTDCSMHYSLHLR
jgi:hypothetical protein